MNHTIYQYEAEMVCQMALHNDILGRILTILKKDDYFRTLEELPVINGLSTYDDIQLYPELYDTAAVIKRVTSKADLIEQQLHKLGMYPLPKTPLPSVSGFIPRPSSTFKPVASAAPTPTPQGITGTEQHSPQSTGSTSRGSIACGQGTPKDPAHTNSSTPQGTPQYSHNANSQTQNVAPPQPSVLATQSYQSPPVAHQQ